VPDKSSNRSFSRDVTIHLENQSLILQANTEHLIAADQELGESTVSRLFLVFRVRTGKRAKVSSVIVIGYYYYA
jgi:hypothetical protein